LRPLSDKGRDEFAQDPYLRDIVERNLEIAAQCCIDISHRIISLEGARKPVDYYGAILSMGELGVLPPEFARHMAPLASFRNILVHEYVTIDWELVYGHLQRLDELEQFATLVRVWLRHRTSSNAT
jgi:uncharacterized protein YutE (UPF0331/DUF86 family)